MKASRRITSLLVSFVILIGLSITAYAHPGRTDANGGHYNQSTGEYHYHHGQPEHQHYDMVGDGIKDCPYYFRKSSSTSSTNSSASSSKAISSSVKNSSAASTENQPDPIIQEVPVTPRWVNPTLIAFAIILAALLFSNWSKRKYISTLESSMQQMKEKHNLNVDSLKAESKEKIAGIQEMYESETARSKKLEIDLEAERRKRIDLYQAILDDAMRKKMIDDLGEDYLEKLACVPRGATVDSNGHPHKYVDGHDIYTFYLSSSGKYHRQACHHSIGKQRINAIEIKNGSSRYSPCASCQPELPDTNWVQKYIQYKALFGQKDSSR